MAVLGLVGGPLVLASSTAVVSGLLDDASPWRFAAAVLVAAWEMCLAVKLIARGFTPSVEPRPAPATAAPAPA